MGIANQLHLMNKLLKGIIRYFVISNLVMGVACVGLTAVGVTAYMINHGPAATEVKE